MHASLYMCNIDANSNANANSNADASIPMPVFTNGRFFGTLNDSAGESSILHLFVKCIKQGSENKDQAIIDQESRVKGQESCIKSNSGHAQESDVKGDMAKVNSRGLDDGKCDLYSFQEAEGIDGKSRNDSFVEISTCHDKYNLERHMCGQISGGRPERSANDIFDEITNYLDKNKRDLCFFAQIFALCVLYEMFESNSIIRTESLNIIPNLNVIGENTFYFNLYRDIHGMLLVQYIRLLERNDILRRLSDVEINIVDASLSATNCNVELCQKLRAFGKVVFYNCCHIDKDLFVCMKKSFEKRESLLKRFTVGFCSIGSSELDELVQCVPYAEEVCLLHVGICLTDHVCDQMIDCIEKSKRDKMGKLKNLSMMGYTMTEASRKKLQQIEGVEICLKQPGSEHQYFH